MLNKSYTAAANALDATVTELQTAATNAETRLKGTPATPTTPEVTPAHIEEEADEMTWNTIQLMIAAAKATDAAKVAAALAALK